MDTAWIAPAWCFAIGSAVVSAATLAWLIRATSYRIDELAERLDGHDERLGLHDTRVEHLRNRLDLLERVNAALIVEVERGRRLRGEPND